VVFIGAVKVCHYFNKRKLLPDDIVFNSTIGSTGEA